MISFSYAFHRHMLQGIAPCVTISKEKLSRKLGKGAEKIIKGLMKVEKKELKKERLKEEKLPRSPGSPFCTHHLCTTVTYFHVLVLGECYDLFVASQKDQEVMSVSDCVHLLYPNE